MTQTLKSLYLAEDMDDLKSQLFSRTTMMYNEDQDQTTLLQEAFDQFERAQMTDETDEELAYLRYLTYIHTLRIIKRNVMSDVQKEYYELHHERRKIAFDRIEALLKSLKKRYGDRKIEIGKLLVEKDGGAHDEPISPSTAEKMYQKSDNEEEEEEAGYVKVTNKNNVQEDSVPEEMNGQFENTLLKLQNLILEQKKKLESRIKESASNDSHDADDEDDDDDYLSPEVDSSSQKHFYPLSSPNDVKNASFPSHTPVNHIDTSSYDYIVSFSINDDDDNQIDPVEFMPCSSSPFRKDVGTQSDDIAINNPLVVTQFVHYIIQRLVHDEKALQSLVHEVRVELPGVSIVLLMETLVMEVGTMRLDAEYTAAGQMIKLFMRKKLVGVEEVMKILSSWMFNIICPMVDVYLHSRFFTSCLPTFILAIFGDELNFNWLFQLANSMDKAEFNLPKSTSHNNNNNNNSEKKSGDDDVRMNFIRIIMDRFKRNNNDDDELLEKLWGYTDESLKDSEVEQSIVFQFEVLKASE